MRHLAKLLCLVLLVLLAPTAGAAITCTTIVSPGVSINYTSNTLVSVQSVFTVTCSRSSTSDPTSVDYDVLVDNGTNPTNAPKVNRVTLGAATLRYDLYADSGCTQLWKGRVISDTITWSSPLVTGQQSLQTSFWGCVVTRQTPTASGAYTDQVQMTVQINKKFAAVGTMPVTIYAPALCTVVAAMGNITLAYAAFGPQASGNTSIGVQCTNGMPYTLSTDVPEGVLNGVRYILSLSATNANGTGAPQTHTVTATAPAGQAGTCVAGNCPPATRTHTLTITY